MIMAQCTASSTYGGLLGNMLIKYNGPKCVGISAYKLGGDTSPLKKFITLENAKMTFGFIWILWYDLNRKSDRIL